MVSCVHPNAAATSQKSRKKKREAMLGKVVDDTKGAAHNAQLNAARRSSDIAS